MLIKIYLSCMCMIKANFTFLTDNPVLDELLPKHKFKVLEALSTEIAMKYVITIKFCPELNNFSRH